MLAMKRGARPDQFLAGFARHLLLEHLASDRRVCLFWRGWHAFCLRNPRLFELRMAVRAGRHERPDRAEQYLVALDALASELQLRGCWVREALHQLSLSRPYEGAPLPFVAIPAHEETTVVTLSISSLFKSRSEIRREGIARLDEQLERRDLPERPSRREALERNVRWLYWRLTGLSSEQIAGRHLRESDEGVDVRTVRQGVKQAADLVGITLPRA